MCRQWDGVERTVKEAGEVCEQAQGLHPLNQHSPALPKVQDRHSTVRFTQSQRVPRQAAWERGSG